MQENNIENIFDDETQIIDEDLVEKARSNDEAAMELLIRRYKDVIKLKSQLYYMEGADADDVMQEGMIGLFKAIRSYDREKEASFKTYADLCITRQIFSAIKQATRLKNSPLNNSVSIDSSIGDSEGEATFAELFSASSEDEPESVLILKEKMRKLEDPDSNFFSEMESHVLYEYLQGRDCDEIGKLMNKTPKSIDNALQRIRKKLENHLSKHFLPLSVDNFPYNNVSVLSSTDNSPFLFLLLLNTYCIIL